MKPQELLNYIDGRSCEILGLGVSNLPLAKLLHENGISLTVRDKKPLAELGAEAEALAADGVRFVTGSDAFDRIEGELIFRSPGIRPDISGITEAIAKGAELTSEIQLFLKLTSATTYAVTGSDGKTTSTTLTGKFLQAEADRSGCGAVFVGGNIGEPLLNRLASVTASDRAVMELSSFQLMTVEKAPRFAAITNVSPNHMDWHRESMEEYTEAKTNIFGKETERLVTNADCKATAEIASRLLARDEGQRPALWLFSSVKQSFSEIFPSGCGENDRAIFERNGIILLSDGRTEIPLLSTARIRIPGRHNVENFMTAIGLTYGSVDPSVYGSVADEFCGVEHRLEWIRRVDCVDYYNSSIDSSPSRTAAALSALAGRDITVICGGYDKKIPFEPLAVALCRSVRAVVLTGATKEKIKAAILNCPDYNEDRLTVAEEPDFERAIHLARSLSRPNGCVLLSPACASFDAFKNFAERGNTFRRIVLSLEETTRNG